MIEFRVLQSSFRSGYIIFLLNIAARLSDDAKRCTVKMQTSQKKTVFRFNFHLLKAPIGVSYVFICGCKAICFFSAGTSEIESNLGRNTKEEMNQILK